MVAIFDFQKIIHQFKSKNYNKRCNLETRRNILIKTERDVTSTSRVIGNYIIYKGAARSYKVVAKEEPNSKRDQ